MGLQSVELVLRFEDAFGIEISDEAAARMYTPRDVIDHVMKHVERRARPRCVFQRGFHVIRRAFMGTLPMDRSQVRPQALLADLIPRAERKQRWLQIGSAVGAGEWPSLVRPAWLVNLLALLSAATAGAVSVPMYLHDADHAVRAVLVGIGSLILVSIALAQLTRPWRAEFAADTERVEDLVRWVVAKSPRLVVEEPERWTRERVTLVVRQIVIEELVVTDFDEDSRFVEDMGMN